MNAFVRFAVTLIALFAFVAAPSAQSGGFAADGGAYLLKYQSESWYCGPDGQWKNVIVQETVAVGILDCQSSSVSTIYAWGSTPAMLRNGHVIGYIWYNNQDYCMSKPAFDYMGAKSQDALIFKKLTAQQKAALDAAVNAGAKAYIVNPNSGHRVDCTPFTKEILALY